MLCSKNNGLRMVAGTTASGRVSRLRGEKGSLCRLSTGRAARLASRLSTERSELVTGVSSTIF